MKRQHLYVVLLASALVAPAIGVTQPPPPPPPIDTNQPIPIPFDGGLSIILLAAGAGYAVKKSREKRNKKSGDAARK